jgi:hypothetical protein
MERVHIAASNGGMTKAEREEMLRLVRQREKVLKSAARQRSKEVLADFEVQITAIYRFDDDEVWAQATRAAEIEVGKAQAQVAKRCRELGIPDRFAPELSLDWVGRGENAVNQRRAEFRKAAEAQVAAMEAKAISKIELDCYQLHERIAVSALTSDAAKRFFAAFPSIEALMPALSFAAISGEADMPIAEQLVTPNALRQRKFRERQRALKEQALPALPNRNAGNDGDDNG